MVNDTFESTVREIGNQIFSLIEEDRPKWWQPRKWEGKVLKLCMENDDFRTQILRFIDVYPVLPNSNEIVKHLEEYLAGVELPASIRSGLLPLGSHGKGKSVAAATTKYIVNRMAQRFIAGSNIGETFKNVQQLLKEGKGVE